MGFGNQAGGRGEVVNVVVGYAFKMGVLGRECFDGRRILGSIWVTGMRNSFRAE